MEFGRGNQQLFTPNELGGSDELQTTRPRGDLGDIHRVEEKLS